jgi:hypothetical protein
VRTNGSEGAQQRVSSANLNSLAGNRTHGP